MNNTSPTNNPTRYPEERFRSLYNNLLLRAVNTGSSWIDEEIRIRGGIIGQMLGLPPDSPLALVESRIFDVVRTLEIIHVGTSPAQNTPRRSSTSIRTWGSRMQQKTGGERVRAAYDDALTIPNGDRWNDWELIVALEGIRDNIALETDRRVYEGRLVKHLGLPIQEGPSRTEAAEALAKLWRVIWFLRMYKVCEGSTETFPLWMHAEHGTLCQQLTMALDDRLQRVGRRCIGKVDVVESLCPEARNADHSLNEVYCRQAIRVWSWEVVQAAVLGDVIRYGVRSRSDTRVGLRINAGEEYREKGLTDAALIDLLRTLLDSIRDNRVSIDRKQTRLCKDLEREMTRTITTFVDAVVFGEDAYVDAIYRIQ